MAVDIEENGKHSDAVASGLHVKDSLSTSNNLTA